MQNFLLKVVITEEHSETFFLCVLPCGKPLSRLCVLCGSFYQVISLNLSHAEAQRVRGEKLCVGKKLLDECCEGV